MGLMRRFCAQFFMKNDRHGLLSKMCAVCCLSRFAIICAQFCTKIDEQSLKFYKTNACQGLLTKCDQFFTLNNQQGSKFYKTNARLGLF